MCAFSAAVCLAAGCQATPGLGTVGGWDRNVSQTSDWGEYKPQEEYVLARDVFLLDVPDRTNGPALVPGLGQAVPPGTYRAPASVEDYRSSPGAYRGIIGLVAEGTKLRVDTLRAKGNLRDASVRVVYVKGRLMDGEFLGRTVDLQAVSLYSADPDGGAVALVGPNPDFLYEAP